MSDDYKTKLDQMIGVGAGGMDDLYQNEEEEIIKHQPSKASEILRKARDEQTAYMK